MCSRSMTDYKIEMHTMRQIRNILVAVGEFPQDDAVLARAAEIASMHQANLTIVHVIDFPDGCDLPTSEMATLRQLAERIEREKIEAAVGGAAVELVNPDIFVETGSPALRLIEFCEDLNPDLIVMRAHQGNSIAAKLVGSTTDRIIRAVTAPVLVIKQSVDGPYKSAVQATDNSEDAAEALSYLAGLLPEASLHLVNVVQVLPQFEASMASAGTSEAAITAYRAKAIRKAKDDLRTLASNLSGRAKPTTTRVAVGDPATILLHATRSPKIDLIAVGPGRPGLIRRLLIGSVTQRLVREAACDVLIWHPRKHEEMMG